MMHSYERSKQECKRLMAVTNGSINTDFGILKYYQIKKPYNIGEEHKQAVQ